MDYTKNRCVHQIFEELAAQTPDAIAVVCEGMQFTYKELNNRANQLAYYLRKCGVGPDALVGICMERSIDMVISLLGVLKAGAAYLPLDPAYPKERLKFMIEDSNTTTLITRNNHLKYFVECLVKKICLDNDRNLISTYSVENLSNLTHEESLAYIIYTSGSTGRPKGVCILHKAINSLVINTNYIRFKSTDVVAQVSNFSFDAATFEIWGALLNGACLVLIANKIVLSPDEFANDIRKQRVSVLFLTTALFNQMAREVPNAFPSVRYLLFGGESVDPKCVRMVVEGGPPQHLIHVYGPTECTTFTLWYQIKEITEDAVTVPIGKPVSNTMVYILDKDLQIVPDGVSGEIFIGGQGLASGYLNSPDLTTEKFILNPFANKDGARLYRTGDLARYLPDGDVEFIGRRDHQVKIRGHRIELGEIESFLMQCPCVKDVVVIAREDVPGDKRLVAYIVPEAKSIINPVEIRYFLNKKVPKYMVPSVFLTLTILPLTQNGKVDRKALPKPGQDCHELKKEFVAPRTAVEKALTEIWSEVLKLKQIGIYDNFFELGGHSLLATQLISRISNAFQIELSLRVVFESPVFAVMAQKIEQIKENVGVDQDMDLFLAELEAVSDQVAQKRLQLLG